MELTVHTDGGSRGNPGEGAIGVVIQLRMTRPHRLTAQRLAGAANDELKDLSSFGRKIGIATNNEAEYRAVIEALKEIQLRITRPHRLTAQRLAGAANDLPRVGEQNRVESGELRVEKISLFLDSLLVCEQLNGRYKIKKPHLRALLQQVRQLEQEIGIPVTYRHIPREENKAADKLVNEALDAL